jgi:hypothetical protein
MRKTSTSTGGPSTDPGDLATTMVGKVQWELIEPLDHESDYARFLAEKGEGVHHIAVALTNYDRLHRISREQWASAQ